MEILENKFRLALTKFGEIEKIFDSKSE